MANYLKNTALVLVLLNVVFSTFAQPTGVYILDSNQGIYRDANIRNYSFVDGFVWRTSWAEFEASQGVYNYAGIDHIVQKLDNIDKKLTILFGAYSVEPSYIASQPGVTTYQFTNTINSTTSSRAVPYDGYLLQRFRLFLSSIANHQIFSRTTGTMVALKDHPVLSNIATNIPGLGAIRNVNGLNTMLSNTLPNYSRTKFVDSLTVSMKIQTDNFPTKIVFIPSYKNVNDNITSPTLANFIQSQLLATFDGVQNPKIGFWQENLAGFKDPTTNIFTGLPTTTFATPLLGLGNSAYTMFQLLQGWTIPFLDPAKTANSTPFDAMCYAYKTYGASYFEVYVSDIDNPDYQQSFKDWNVTNCTSPSSIQQLTDKNYLNIYPNPSSRSMSISGINVPEEIDITIFDLFGQNLINSQKSMDIDISSLSNGVYFVEINQSNKIHVLKFVKGN